MHCYSYEELTKQATLKINCHCSDRTVDSALALHLDNISSIPSTHMVPCALPGVIAGCRVWSKPWLLLDVVQNHNKIKLY